MLRCAAARSMARRSSWIHAAPSRRSPWAGAEADVLILIGEDLTGLARESRSRAHVPAVVTGWTPSSRSGLAHAPLATALMLSHVVESGRNPTNSVLTPYM